MDFNAIGAAAGTVEDLTVEKTFERELPKAGVAMLRLLEYIELGRFKPNNPTYKPAHKVILTFELNHPKHMIEIDGKKVPQTLQVRLNKGTTAKSGFMKLFKLMNEAAGGKYVHFAQMIGLPFLGTIYHNEVGEGKDKKVYANLDKDGAYSLRAPVQIDPVTEEVKKIAIPEMQGTGKVFLWENEAMTDEQVLEMWDSIYIEGTREIEDPKSKTKTEVSKNWIQELIMTNLDWEGSTTQALTQDHIELDELEGEEELATLEEEPVEEASKVFAARSAMAAAAATEDELPTL